MLQLFPFLPLMAVATSAVLLASLWWIGALRAVTTIVLSGWLAAAIYCQFVASSGITAAIGLALQTLLAIYLIVRWRLRA